MKRLPYLETQRRSILIFMVLAVLICLRFPLLFKIFIVLSSDAFCWVTLALSWPTDCASQNGWLTKTINTLPSLIRCQPVGCCELKPHALVQIRFKSLFWYMLGLWFCTNSLVRIMVNTEVSLCWTPQEALCIREQFSFPHRALNSAAISSPFRGKVR